MSCGPEPTTFRLLDRHAQWTLDLIPEPGKVTINEVIQLAQIDPLAVDPSQLSTVMPPPWLAKGCGPCEWYLACCPTVLRYAPRIVDECKPCAPADPCADPVEPDASCFGWVPVGAARCHIELVHPAAVAATRDHVAILDVGRHELFIVSPGGERVIASIPTHARGPIAFWRGAIVVADHDDLVAYDLTTLGGRALPSAPGPVVRMIAATEKVVPTDPEVDCEYRSVLWLAIDVGGGVLELWRLDPDGTIQPGNLADLIATATPTGIVASDDQAVCLAIPRGGSEPRKLCIDRCGRPAQPLPPPGPALVREGSIATGDYSPGGLRSPLDSGIPRCNWHRVRIELDLPARTGLTVSLATAEDASADIADEDWQHVGDASAIHDFLLDQPPGRYLHLRFLLRGDGFATPKIRRVRIDFPRSTSATRLPGVYREDPVAADFLDRFIATYDASIEDLDRIIARFPALLDPKEGAPAEALAWIGTFLDIVLDPSWSEATRRAILAEAPELYRRRGTCWAVSRAIELTTGVVPAIQELGGGATFARLAKTRDERGFTIGQARLFGAAKTRFWLGASGLGRAPLRSYGDPDRDYAAATGWRVLVQVPRFGDADAVTRLRKLIDAQKPAHVVTRLRVGGELALLGIDSAVGIDTRLGGLQLPYLGVNTRLRRVTALAKGLGRGGAALAVGTSSAVSIQTVLS